MTSLILRISFFVILLSSPLDTLAQTTRSSNPVLDSLQFMSATQAKRLIDNGFVYVLSYGKLSIERSASADCRDSIAQEFGFQYLHVAGCELPKELENGFKTYNDEVDKYLANQDPKWQQKFDRQVEKCSRDLEKNSTEPKGLTVLNCEITFDQKTQYEIYDSFGSLIEKGVSAMIDVSGFKKGMYYINYGQKSSKFLVPKKCS